MRRSLHALIVCACLAGGCAHVDADAAQLSLLQADIEFDRDVAQRGLEAWVAVFAPDGAVFPAGEPLARGPEQIRALMVKLGDPRKAPPEFTLHWKPLGAEVSADGSLGWTYGQAIVTSASGQRRTKYVTVWRKTDGRWKIVADIGAPGEAVPGAGP